MNNSICCLCGNPIVKGDLSNSASKDHVPPKQFYPEELRKTKNLNLWTVPTHKCCNGSYREDEEYFYLSMLSIVNDNAPIGQMIFSDLKRRKHKPQIQAVMRKILKTSTTVTEEGILLPPGCCMLNIDKIRIQRIVIKICQGLFFRDKKLYMPCKNCIDINLYSKLSDVPEFYELSWHGAESKAACNDVFSYRGFHFENLYVLSLLFWESVMFCCTFEYPLYNINCKIP